ncbi:terpene synthase family protein [Embleya sp. AB8]|uniref:terpene synthase family protein n=1 Tax=Embleya sp. AB8 TaxID=3156304 RepID=UPI003C75FDA1
MRRFGYITSLAEELAARAAQFGELGALTYPHDNLSGAVLAAQLMVWLFLQDDRFSELAPAQDRIEDLAEHILWSQRVLHTRITQSPASSEQYSGTGGAIRRRLHCYLGAVAAGVIYRARGITPDLGQYLRLRESTILMRGVCFVIIELADDCYLPGLLWARPEVRRCEPAAARAIADTHDILSGMRELYWPGHTNLITVLADHLDRPLSETLDKAVGMYNSRMHRFTALAKPLAEEGDPRLTRYIRGMGAWIRGNRDWSMN